MKATDLRGALNVLDPERPLETDEDLRDLFVERPDSPIDELAMLLEGTDRPQKILFTGHRGSGKSTELARLSQRLRDEFFIVRYSVKSVLNLFDLTHVDVVLSLALELIKQATAKEVGIRISGDVGQPTDHSDVFRPAGGVDVADLQRRRRVRDVNDPQAREAVCEVGQPVHHFDLLRRSACVNGAYRDQRRRRDWKESQDRDQDEECP